eukprot:1144641-Pelagomonas_calceolata.AAC.2
MKFSASLGDRKIGQTFWTKKQATVQFSSNSAFHLYKGLCSSDKIVCIHMQSFYHGVSSPMSSNIHYQMA